MSIFKPLVFDELSAAANMILILQHEPHVAAELEYAFNSTGAHA
jgi:hypothetical protein